MSNLELINEILLKLIDGNNEKDEISREKALELFGQVMNWIEKAIEERSSDIIKEGALEECGQLRRYVSKNLK